MPSKSDIKAQQIRLLDVLVIGPVMIGAATKAKDLPPAVRVVLGLSGISTMFYNLDNYLTIRNKVRKR